MALTFTNAVAPFTVHRQLTATLAKVSSFALLCLAVVVLHVVCCMLYVACCMVTQLELRAHDHGHPLLAAQAHRAELAGGHSAQSIVLTCGH